MTRLTIAIIILSIALAVSLFFVINGRQTSQIDRDQIERMKFERDSTNAYNTAVSKEKEAAFKSYADSLINYNQFYVKADSINKITIYNAKKQLKYLNRAGRDRVRDSIFSANNLPATPK